MTTSKTMQPKNMPCVACKQVMQNLVLHYGTWQRSPQTDRYTEELLQLDDYLGWLASHSPIITKLWILMIGKGQRIKSSTHTNHAMELHNVPTYSRRKETSVTPNIQLTSWPSGEESIHYWSGHLDHSEPQSPDISLHPDDHSYRDVVYTHCHACWKVGKMIIFCSLYGVHVRAHVLNCA